MTDQEKTNLLLEACHLIGHWLSAAIDDPRSCDEFREALEVWFSAMGNFEMGQKVEWPTACGIWSCGIGFQNIIVNCWLKDGELVIDQIGSDTDRGIGRDNTQYKSFSPVMIYTPKEPPFYVESQIQIP